MRYQGKGKGRVSGRPNDRGSASKWIDADVSAVADGVEAGAGASAEARDGAGASAEARYGAGTSAGTSAGGSGGIYPSHTIYILFSFFVNNPWIAVEITSFLF